jgi:hypothetical protein
MQNNHAIITVIKLTINFYVALECVFCVALIVQGVCSQQISILSCLLTLPQWQLRSIEECSHETEHNSHISISQATRLHGRLGSLHWFSLCLVKESEYPQLSNRVWMGRITLKSNLGLIQIHDMLRHLKMITGLRRIQKHVCLDGSGLTSLLAGFFPPVRALLLFMCPVW